MAERDRLKPGEPMAAFGAAAEDRQLVADQPAAAAGEDRRPIDQARPVLLAALGGEQSDAATLRGYAAPDRFAVHAGGVGEPAARISVSREAGVGKVLEGKGRRRALGFSGGTKLAVPWPAEALGTSNPTDNCVQRWVKCIVSVGRKAHKGNAG